MKNIEFTIIKSFFHIYGNWELACHCLDCGSAEARPAALMPGAVPARATCLSLPCAPFPCWRPWDFSSVWCPDPPAIPCPEPVDAAAARARARRAPMAGELPATITTRCHGGAGVGQEIWPAGPVTARRIDQLQAREVRNRVDRVFVHGVLTEIQLLEGMLRTPSGKRVNPRGS
jgi:hypothetical protein